MEKLYVIDRYHQVYFEINKEEYKKQNKYFRSNLIFLFQYFIKYETEKFKNFGEIDFENLLIVDSVQGTNFNLAGTTLLIRENGIDQVIQNLINKMDKKSIQNYLIPLLTHKESYKSINIDEYIKIIVDDLNKYSDTIITYDSFVQFIDRNQNISQIFKDKDLKF